MPLGPIPVELIVGSILSIVQAHEAEQQRRATAEQQVILAKAREHKDSLRALAELTGTAGELPNE